MADRTGRGGLLRRNLALLAGVVLAGQLLAGALVMALVIRPQVQRVAHVTADMAEGLSLAMRDMPPEARERLVARLNRSGGVRIRAHDALPSDGPRFPSFVERQFIRSLAVRLSEQDALAWRTDSGHRLWISLKLGGQDYWVSVTPPARRGAMTSLLLSFGTAFVVALAGGLALQRRLNRPLRDLADGVERYARDTAAPAPLDTSGPHEIAAVAGAFNRMAERLSEQDAQRALMLAGISHDLRTPLAKIRLALALEKDLSPETEALVERQLDQMDRMIGQFLDFGRETDNQAHADVDLAELARAAADGPGPALAVDVTGNPVVRGQPLAIERAIQNLVANARQYGAAPIHIAVHGATDTVSVAVSDAGPGIPEHRLADIARPFVRGETARSGATGTGLGLAIAESVARAHGGRLLLENRPGGGLRAAIELARVSR